MDAELKGKWVKALRSKKYKQTRAGELHDGKGFCCLGVLADVMGCDWKSKTIDGIFIEREEEAYLSDPIQDRVGLTFRTQTLLARMNDGGEEATGASFPEIATYIEANL